MNTDSERNQGVSVEREAWLTPGTRVVMIIVSLVVGAPMLWLGMVMTVGSVDILRVDAMSETLKWQRWFSWMLIPLGAVCLALVLFLTAARQVIALWRMRQSSARN